ncbi:uncharacterized protein G2W53_017869 [Senna tora]|uniref:Uncharacterized protein n=1 Tax=Senna tora TaxID=362788 RepID=A0A834TUX4_9FABA|nr:uncharacterized protein G2W53_017869 [Senna tora]
MGYMVLENSHGQTLGHGIRQHLFTRNVN